MLKLRLFLKKWLGSKLLQLPPDGATSWVPAVDEHGNGMLLDRWMVEYLQSNAPNPTQHSLDRVLKKVNRVRVLQGGVIRGKALGTEVLLEVSDPGALSTLSECLMIIEDENAFGHCMCFGEQALELYAGPHLVAMIGLHHGRSIRWDAWKHDALLEDGHRLLVWLADRGVTSPLEAYQEGESRAEVYRQAAIRWQQAMPACLSPFWEEMQAASGNRVLFIPFSPKGQGRQRQVEEVIGRIIQLLQVLESAYPNQDIRILELFRWYGSGTGAWNGFPLYERVPEELLLAFRASQLVTALTHYPLTPAHLEGAARFFAGSHFNTYRASEARQISPWLKQTLLAHSLTSLDEDRIMRAKNTFTD
jgi:hypothetical protein